MSRGTPGQRSFIRCLNCGEIMTGAVSQAGEIYPVGLGNDGKCGDAEFEVLAMASDGATEGNAP